MRAKALAVGLIAVGLLLGTGAAAPAQGADADARANAKARAEAAQTMYKAMYRIFWRGEGLPGVALAANQGEGLELFYRWSIRWLEAEIEASATKAEQTAAAERHLNRMRELETKTRTMIVKGGVTPPFYLSSAEFYRLDAEKRLRELRPRPMEAPPLPPCPSSIGGPQGPPAPPPLLPRRRPRPARS
jgi:hypothetical protein